MVQLSFAFTSSGRMVWAGDCRAVQSREMSVAREYNPVRQTMQIREIGMEDFKANFSNFVTVFYLHSFLLYSPFFLHFSFMVCQLQWNIAFVIMWNMILCHVIKCDTSVSLKLLPLRSVLILIILEQEPICCSCFFYSEKKSSRN